MEIKRDIHLNRLISRKNNRMIKVVTGVRRCGKSYLLFELFCNHLKEQGVDDRHIIRVDLEDRRNELLRDPDTLLQYIDSRFVDTDMHYILLDEVQLVHEFEDVLNSFLKVKNADVYVTGSNARFLSKDVITEFRGRGDEVRIAPLSFSEFMSVRSGNRDDLLNEYMTYGGLPQVVLTEDENAKAEYLKNVFTHTYLRDIKERYGIRRDGDIEDLMDIIASNLGTLTNPTRIENTFRSVKHSTITKDTIKSYLDMLQDSFLVNKSLRYDIKGRRYIDTPSKYYFEDTGLRNARLGFRQTEFPHLLENVVYNELRLRGFSVDVGQVEITGRTEHGNRKRSLLEVDFVCNKGYRRYYIQTALAMPDAEKANQELNPLRKIEDGFQKFVILGSPTPKYQNSEGITIMNIFDFLLHPDSLSV